MLTDLIDGHKYRTKLIVAFGIFSAKPSNINIILHSILINNVCN